MGHDIAQHSRDALDYWTLGATIAGVVILAIYTAATLWQAKLTNAALAETRRSNKTAKRSLELGRRAWLILEIANDYSIEEPWSNITIKNIGGVPAEVSLIDVRAVWVKTLPVTLEFTPITQVQLSGGLVTIDKRQKYMIIPPDKHSSTETQPVDWNYNDNNGFILAYCRIEYTDVFKKRRITESGWTLSEDPRSKWYAEDKYSKLK